MSTLVGKQSDFAEALKELLELDYDAIGAYEAAIQRLENIIFKEKLIEFKMDHEHHTQKLTAILVAHNVSNIPQGPDAPKSWLAKGKVVLAGLKDDETILEAMLTNEQDTNTAYERLVNHPAKWPETDTMLRQGLADERRHKAWIEQNIEQAELKTI